MKKVIAFAVYCSLIAVLSCFHYKSARAQSAVANMKQLDETQLNTKERAFAAAALRSKFVSKYWYAEVSFDPTANELQITLPEMDVLSFTIQRRNEQADGLSAWCGKSADGATATLVWHNGMIHGNIAVNPRLVYSIQPIGGNRHIIYIINQQHAPKEESREQYEGMKLASTVPAEMNQPRFELPEADDLRTGGNDCYIRVLVGFDHDAALSEADPIGFALECAELSNTIYANSQVNFQMEIAYVRNYPDVASSDIDDALAEWEFDFGNDKFNDVFSEREQYDADFCILIAEDFDGDYVGLAATILASYGSAFCVVERGSAIDNLSFTHEIGHLMGARHDLYMDGSGDFNHGYIIHSEKVRTVMAYDDECDDNGYNCDRIQYFSTPDVNFPGTSKPLGTAADEHNERALDENESEFADFEPVVSNKTFLFPEFVDGSIYGNVTALNTIQHIADYQVTGGAQVVWSAGDYIVLEDGFYAGAGASFQAKLGGCDALRIQDGNMEQDASTGSFQNMNLFPNPAASETTVSFQLEEKSTVSINMVDLQGRVVFKSMSQLYEAGTQLIDINCSSFTSGTYLCYLIINGEPVVSKLIVQQD
ncbi:MAG: T9SS type A sorting domain-containing protein [Chitinophagaceae bacterium]|nr:T9SS type A sorting domain-containing protein [Chitinophagaceae bacterium]